MNESNPSRRNPATTIGINVLVLAIFRVVGFLLVRFLTPGAVPGTVWQLVAAIIGVLIALRLRARPAAYLLGAIIAVMTSETLIALYYGRSALQGAATHFAVLGAGFIGVALGAWLVARYPLSTPART
jgi:hypothetical protein